MISTKKAVEAAQTIAGYCAEQPACQNCIFRKFGADSWRCHIGAFDIRDVLSNVEAKRKGRGYIG